MPIRPSSFRDYNISDIYTPGQELIYQCESETQTVLPGILPFEEWAGVIDDIWSQVRHRLEDGPVALIRGRSRLKRRPDEQIVESTDSYNFDSHYERVVTPMSEIPIWIEKYPENLPVKWTALWAEPNIIIAGHKPLHVMTAVHEVAHAYVYYQHGWSLREKDNGHGPIWKQTYLNLLKEFLPKHAELLHATFEQNGVDI